MMPFVLPPLTLAVFLLVPGPWFWAVLLLQLAVMGLTQKTITQYYQTLEKGESGFTRFHEAFSTLERQAFVHPHLETLRKGLDVEGEFVSKRLARLSRLFAFVEVRQSGQMHGLLNAALLWDLLFVFPLESWRQQEGRHVRAWFSALAEFDALSAMATFTFEHPHYIFPTVEEGPAHFVAHELGHPLLKTPVCNDVMLDRPHQAIIITGSNMSGKTTYLRTLGIAAVMAQTGLPVLAKSMKMSSLQVLTSMRVKDSLERGVSYFYAEVQRLKLLLDAVRLGNSLFLLDEILMGTNTAERQMASRDVLLQFLRQEAIGGVSTHDLSLTEWPRLSGLFIENRHFRDLLENGQMSFDYRIQPGVVSTTNALRVMQQAGIHLSSEALNHGSV